MLSGNSAPPKNGATPADLASRKQEREYYLKDAKGDIVGGNYKVPGGDFARVLGFAPATAAEAAGKQALSGSRTIELALQKQLAHLGQAAQKNGMSFRNQYVSIGSFENSPGREKDMLKDGLDAIREGPEKRQSDKMVSGLGGNANANYMQKLEEYHLKSKEDNMRYLEMQYKFMYASKAHATISNLMKVRSDAVKKAINDSR